jgi:hypothetical protein
MTAATIAGNDGCRAMLPQIHDGREKSTPIPGSKPRSMAMPYLIRGSNKVWHGSRSAHYSHYAK